MCLDFQRKRWRYIAQQPEARLRLAVLTPEQLALCVLAWLPLNGMADLICEHSLAQTLYSTVLFISLARSLPRGHVPRDRLQGKRSEESREPQQ